MCTNHVRGAPTRSATLAVPVTAVKTTMLLDAERSLPLAIQRSTENTLGSDLATTIKLSDWREVAGVKSPFRRELELPMAGTMRTEFSAIEANARVDDGVIAVPK